MSRSSPPEVDNNVERFSGFADIYETYRPALPTVVIDILTQLAKMEQPNLVVDIGCGTGLSTRPWANRAKRIIGIDPNHQMRVKAEEKSRSLPNITYQAGTAMATGLPHGCADIVMMSQALHWAEPSATFGEIARILRPGGIFAAIDYDVPPLTTMEIHQLASAYLEQADVLIAKHLPQYQPQLWNKAEHLSRMQASGQFANVTECAVYGQEIGDVDRIIGFILSHGSTQTLLQHGFTDKKIGLSALRTRVKHLLGQSSIPIYFTYRIRIGQKSNK
jgi:ubiquinone/menaquinone biosynthesis C-methylase UbiE